jgi:hypothetical protein
MGSLFSTVTSTNEKDSIAVNSTRVDSVHEDDLPKPKDLATTLHYYDEPADKAKIAEPVDPTKEQPKVLVHRLSILLLRLTSI